MALLHYLWSRVAANNATADAPVQWPEGMAPSQVNDSARAMMASLAGFRDDISGAIVTTGTSTAYAVTSYQVFDSLAHMSGMVIAFTPHATNGATVTLNVDGLGAKPLRSSPGVELAAGMLVLGTPYVALYNNSDAAWYLRGFYGNPYNIPLAGGIDYWGTSAPNSAFAFAFGQAISRTTYAGMFALMGTSFGVGDGSTTFNIPDKRGRVSAGCDNMGGSSAGRLTGGSLNFQAGTETTTLAAGNIPAHTHSGTTGVDSPDHTHTVPNVSAVNSVAASGGAGVSVAIGTTQSGGASARHAHAFTTDGGSGLSGTAFSTLQPTIACNYILRIL